MTIVIFILIFGVIVTAHELGHFLLAKKNGIKVNEFAIGMGPALFKTQKGETLYAIRLLPIGGACIFEGEDGIYKDGEDSESEATRDIKGSFNSANVWARIACVIAGPVFNVILAFLLALVLVGLSGTDLPVIQGITEDYPASEAGIKAGDIITKVNGNKTRLYREVSLESMINNGEPIEIEYERAGESFTTEITPKYSEEDARYYIGIIGSGEYYQPKGIEVVKYGFYEVRFSFISTLKGLLLLVTGKLGGDDLAGPVGMAVMVDDIVETASPYGFMPVFLTLINFSILISVNLGIMNLLPLPALDGGRLVFLFIEVVRGKPVSPQKEGFVHFLGFVALMILMVVVLFNDIQRLF